MSSCIVCASSAGDAVPCCGVCVCQDCLRASAAASGSLFACPACRERDAFRAHAVQKGIHIDEKIPDYVNTGAASTNERLCCAERCRSPRGPAFDTTAERLTRGSAEDQSRWRLIPCLSCGGCAIHAGCSGGRRLVSLARWRAHEARWRCDDCGGSDEAPELAETPFVVGDRIEARWAGRTTWYPGVIEAIDGDRYGILYDDSETESGVAEALIRLEPTSAAPVSPALPSGSHEGAAPTAPVPFCVACWTGDLTQRHTCPETPPWSQIPIDAIEATSLLPFRAKNCAKFRRNRDTVHGVACELVAQYNHPLLYRNPKGPAWWSGKLDASRTSFEALLDIIAEVALANPYAFARRKGKLDFYGRGADILRLFRTCADREPLGLQLGRMLLTNKALPAIVEIAKARWAEVQQSTNVADASLLMTRADELFTKDVVAYFETKLAKPKARGGRTRNEYPPHDDLVHAAQLPVRLREFRLLAEVDYTVGLARASR